MKIEACSGWQCDSCANRAYCQLKASEVMRAFVAGEKCPGWKAQRADPYRV